MKRLSFAVDSRIDVPVEVYDDDLALVGRTLSSSSLELDRGNYLVVGKMPDGADYRAALKVVDSEPEEVVLAAPVLHPTSEGLAAAGAAPAGDDLSEDHSRLLDSREPFLAHSQTYRGLRFARGGEVLTRYRLDPGGWHAISVERLVHVGSTLSLSGCDAFGLRDRDGVERFVLGSGGRYSRSAFGYLELKIRTAPDDTQCVSVGLANESADALLDYLARGLFGDALAMVDSPALNAERLLQEKVGDPVAAAAGAFVLLQLGELERLHDWTANLAEWFDWLPDATVAYAEHLARIGKHAAASDLLKRLASTSPPLLGIGMAYAAGRLRLYAADDPHDAELADALARVTAYAVAADPRAKVTTFTGTSPHDPRPRASAWPA